MRIMRCLELLKSIKGPPGALYWIVFQKDLLGALSGFKSFSESQTATVGTCIPSVSYTIVYKSACRMLGIREDTCKEGRRKHGGSAGGRHKVNPLGWMTQSQIQD